MFKKRKEVMSEEQLRPTWDYLIALERRLRRNTRLCRILQPVSSVIFLFNLLLAVMNLAKFVGSETMNAHFDKIPVLPALVESLPRGSWTGVLVFTVLFTFGISLAVSGAITGVTYLLDRRDAPEKRPLNGTLAQRANAVVNEAETVYELRRAMPTWSIYLETGVLTALSAFPIVMTLLQYAEGTEPSVLWLALYFCALLVCLFVLFWVYALLLWCFARLNSLFYRSPSAWSLYTLYQELDAYWESVDPDEFDRRDRSRRESRKKRKPAETT